MCHVIKFIITSCKVKLKTAQHTGHIHICVQFQDEPLGKNPLTTSKKVWKHEITHANQMVKGNYNFMVIYWQSSWKMVPIPLCVSML